MFLFRWLWKNMQGYRAVYITGLLFGMICQSFFIWTPYISQQIIDTFIYNDDAAYNLSHNSGLLISMLLTMVGLTFLRTVFQYSGAMLTEKASQGLIYRVRGYLFDNMQAQDATFFDYYRTGDIMTRLSGDIEMVRHSVAWIIKTILECVVIFTITVVYFFILDEIMALCIIALTPVIFFISYLFRRVARPMYEKLRERLAEMNTAAEENISGNRVVKAFAREEFEIGRFGKKNVEYRDANQNAALTWLKFFPALEITAQALWVVQMIVGGLFVINGRLTLGEYAAFSGLVWAVANPMRLVGNIINDLQRFTASANKIIEVYYSRTKIVSRVDAVELTERIKGDIEFKNVSFKYGSTTVLEDISFTIKAGQTVAIMGETGSGKTSLVNLIPRIYDVNSGAITVDGVNIRMMKVEQLRAGVGMATQDVLLYSDTVEGNIAFGSSELSFEEVTRYAADADADSFITKMSDGYDTIIGERGVGLSGGQKQRIALARALAVKPSILILDDTTSAVDLETEKQIQESLASLDFSCTKIIIAQRISSTKHADMILVLKDGKIAEAGTHDELLAEGGYYREVYDLQA